MTERCDIGRFAPSRRQTGSVWLQLPGRLHPLGLETAASPSRLIAQHEPMLHFVRVVVPPGDVAAIVEAVPPSVR